MARFGPECHRKKKTINTRLCLRLMQPVFLGMLLKQLCKANFGHAMSVCLFLSARLPFAWNSITPPGKIFVKFCIFNEICRHFPMFVKIGQK
jgi:hypothetical protein